MIHLVQHGTVELHTWGLGFNHPQPPTARPDHDRSRPRSGPPWARLADAARLVRALVEEIGLKGFLKTTGGKGLHVVIPLERRHGWEEVKSFARAIAGAPGERDARPVHRERRQAAARWTGLRGLSTQRRSGDRGRRLFGARTPRRAVSMPIEWDELVDEVRGSRYNVRNVPDLLARRRTDPWSDYTRSARRLTRPMLRKLGGRSSCNSERSGSRPVFQIGTPIARYRSPSLP